MEFPVPRTYRDLLCTLDKDALLSFMRGFFKGDLATADLFTNRINEDNLMNSFLDKFSSASYIKGIPDQISKDELKALREIIRKGGFLRPGDKHFPEKSTVDGLVEKKLAFRSDGADGRGVAVPLEICLGLPFDKNEEYRSLMRAMNRYSSDIIKLMAPHLGIPQYNKLHKIRLAAVVYKRIIENYSQYIGSLTDLQKKIIRHIFRRGGFVSNGNLDVWAKANGMKESGGQRSWYGGDYFLDYMSTAYRRKKEDLSDLEKALLHPVLSGVVCVSYRETYDSIWHYFIPEEVFPLLAGDFFREMDEKREVARKTMRAAAPDVFVSYSGRVAEDLIKVQIAAACGLVGFVKNKPEFKKRSISDIAGLLNSAECYVENLFRLLGFHPSGMNIINYSSFDLLKSYLFKYEYVVSLLPILQPFQGWVHMDGLIKYLLNHRDLYRFSASLSENVIESALKDLGMLGLLDISPDGKRAQVAPLLSKMFDSPHFKSIGVIKGDSRPLIVQPNLELLIPMNTEIKALKKLSEFSDLIVLDKMLHFALSKKSLMRGLDLGWDIKKVITFLSSISSKDVPKTVENFVETCLNKRGEAVVMPSSTLIHCKGLGLKSKILSMRGLKAEGLEGADDYLYISAQSPGEVLRILKKHGIFAELAEEGKQADRSRK